MDWEANSSKKALPWAIKRHLMHTRQILLSDVLKEKLKVWKIADKNEAVFVLKKKITGYGIKLIVIYIMWIYLKICGLSWIAFDSYKKLLTPYPLWPNFRTSKPFCEEEGESNYGNPFLVIVLKDMFHQKLLV